MKRLGVIVAALFMLILLVSLVACGRSNETVPTAEETPTSRASASPAPFGTKQQDADELVQQRHQIEGETNPLLTKLPYTNEFFTLTYGVGDERARYVLEASVYYVVGQEDPQQKVARVKPMILRYLREIGQPDNTYDIEYIPTPSDNSQG